MHESSLAKQLLEAALAAADRSDAAAVRAVRAWIAETEALDPQAIELHFRAHARSTIASDARLELDLRRVEARCSVCHGIFVPEHHITLCPHCGNTEAVLLGQTGVGIDTIEVD